MQATASGTFQVTMTPRAAGDSPAALGRFLLAKTFEGALEGMLLYAFNDQDEVAPAQSLNAFAKKNPTLAFVGAITADGQFMDAADVKALANLPTKDQLRAQLVGTIGAPLSGFANVLAGNVRGVMNVLNARAEAIG